MAHSVHGLVVGELAVLEELRQEVGGSFDWSCNELREERDKRKEGDDVFGRFDILAIYVDGIAEGLEGVERDTYWQDDFDKQTFGRDPEQLTELTCEEVVVLEDRQNAEIQNDIGNHPSFGLASR